ncbi:hypothetical protein Syun_007454 [Stephania yunnanensis]|uniref:Uncharacterized protein n=1 Tax=Stephania yunnanensis TaxID=152371 RepID=A0AAP0KYI6_9MAGN
MLTRRPVIGGDDVYTSRGTQRLVQITSVTRLSVTMPRGSIGRSIISIGDYLRTYRAGGGGGSKSEIGSLDWKRINDALDKHLQKASPSTSRRLNDKDKLAMASTPSCAFDNPPETSPVQPGPTVAEEAQVQVELVIPTLCMDRYIHVMKYAGGAANTNTDQAYYVIHNFLDDISEHSTRGIGEGYGWRELWEHTHRSTSRIISIVIVSAKVI